MEPGSQVFSHLIQWEDRVGRQPVAVGVTDIAVGKAGERRVSLVYLHRFPPKGPTQDGEVSLLRLKVEKSSSLGRVGDQGRRQGGGDDPIGAVVGW